MREEGLCTSEDKRLFKDVNTAVEMAIQCSAHCLLCKAPGHFEVTNIPGLQVYEVKPSDGWHLVAEVERTPLAVFILCPECKSHAK